MGELEELVADIGVKQWVKNLFITELLAFKKAGRKDVDEFTAKFNAKILKEFKIVARETVDETIKYASTLLKEETKEIMDNEDWPNPYSRFNPPEPWQDTEMEFE